VLCNRALAHHALRTDSERHSPPLPTRSDDERESSKRTLTLHTSSLPSLLPVARNLPKPGSNEIEYTKSVARANVCRSVPLSASHSLAVESNEQLRGARASGSGWGRVERGGEERVDVEGERGEEGEERRERG